jgi:SAM-dependent methyltransferase
MIDYDARLVELYDDDNPDGPDHDFYRALADQVDAASILDVGAGTGMLTVTLARPGRAVVGVDPSPAMLAYARQRAGGDQVTWVCGDSRAAPAGAYDLTVMTGNVAQHIPDADWERTLGDIHQKMAAGGVLAFESRNPGARAWTRWTSAEQSERTTKYGALRQWSEAREIEPGQVRLTEHSGFLDDGEQVTKVALLCFRDRVTIERQLTAAGFEVQAVYGDWHCTPFTDVDAVMVFVARAR